MKATTKIELPLGVTVPEFGTPFTFDKDAANALIDVRIVRVDRGDRGHSVVVALELDVEVEAVFDMQGKVKPGALLSRPDHDVNSRGVRVGFVKKDEE